MPAPNARQDIKETPLKIVGGNLFGRYSKISDEQTFNMIVSDQALVPYAGYKSVVTLNPTETGRGLYTARGNFMIAVIGPNVYKVTASLSYSLVGTLETSVGDVYISENNASQVCLTDGQYVYVYDYTVPAPANTFVSNVVGSTGAFVFVVKNPGYLSFQNGRLIIASGGTQLWYLSGFNNATSWPTGAANIGSIQAKPCFIQAVVPVPGGGNNIIIMGTNVSESWTDLGLALFPYQRNSTFNIDYGCLNASSVAELDNFIVWLAVNEQSGPIIMYSDGHAVKPISTDGIDFKLASLSNPTDCTGFLFRQDGHLIYQFSFPTDNLSYIYDFNTQMFFTVTDDNLNYHIARQVVFFNNQYYFVSLNSGNIYGFGTQYTDADYGAGVIREIPRIRVTPPLRLDTQRYFVCKSLGFTIENGLPNTITSLTYTPPATVDIITTEHSYDLLTEGGDDITTERQFTTPIVYETRSEAVDLSASRDGGVTFGSSVRLEMNKIGKRNSRFIFQRLGIANDITFQLRFSGFGRFVVLDGVVEIFQ